MRGFFDRTFSYFWALLQEYPDKELAQTDLLNWNIYLGSHLKGRTLRTERPLSVEEKQLIANYIVANSHSWNFVFRNFYSLSLELMGKRLRFLLFHHLI
jgi:hypothetical protein